MVTMARAPDRVVITRLRMKLPPLVELQFGSYQLPIGGSGRLGAFELAVVLWRFRFRSETVPGARVLATARGFGKHRLELRCYFLTLACEDSVRNESPAKALQ
jgi:hypothetical protein